MNEKYIKLKTFIITIIILILLFITSIIFIISYYKDKNVIVTIPTEVEIEDDTNSSINSITLVGN